MENFLKEFVFVVFYRFKLVLAIFLIFVSIAIAIALLLPPVYQATAIFSLIVPKSLDPLRREDFFDYQSRIRYLVQDQRELILSNRVLRKVAKEHNPSGKTEQLFETIDKIRNRVQVTPPKGETFENTNVFYLTLEGDDPAQVSHVARAIVKTYLEAYREISRAKTVNSHAFFKQQTEKLYEDMLGKEKELREFETKEAVTLIEILNLEGGAAKTNMEVGLNAMLTSFMRKYHELNEELITIQVSINALEKELKSKGIPVVLPEMETTGRAISIFKNKLAQLQIELNEMRPQFQNDFIPMEQARKELNLNIDSLRQELERTIDARKITAQVIKARIQVLEKVIQDSKEQIRSTTEKKSVYEHLKQEYTLAKDAYTQARNQLEQTRLATALNQEEQYLTLVDEPVVPSRPVKPNRPLLIVLGLIGGVFLSIATALTVDFFDHTIKSPQDIERHLRVPCYGSLSKAT